MHRVDLVRLERRRASALTCGCLAQL
jgi:hypothetical protein